MGLRRQDRTPGLSYHIGQFQTPNSLQLFSNRGKLADLIILRKRSSNSLSLNFKCQIMVLDSDRVTRRTTILTGRCSWSCCYAWPTGRAKLASRVKLRFATSKFDGRIGGQFVRGLVGDGRLMGCTMGRYQLTAPKAKEFWATAMDSQSTVALNLLGKLLPHLNILITVQADHSGFNLTSAFHGKVWRGWLPKLCRCPPTSSISPQSLLLPSLREFSVQVQFGRWDVQT